MKFFKDLTFFFFFFKFLLFFLIIIIIYIIKNTISLLFKTFVVYKIVMMKIFYNNYILLKFLNLLTHENIILCF